MSKFTLGSIDHGKKYLKMFGLSFNCKGVNNIDALYNVVGRDMPQFQIINIQRQ